MLLIVVCYHVVSLIGTSQVSGLLSHILFAVILLLDLHNSVILRASRVRAPRHVYRLNSSIAQVAIASIIRIVFDLSIAAGVKSLALPNSAKYISIHFIVCAQRLILTAIIFVLETNSILTGGPPVLLGV